MSTPSVTMADVQVLIQIPASVTTLDAFITVAHELLENTVVTDYPDAFTEDYLTEIERWLAAHFTAIRYTRTSSETIGQTSESYQYKVDLDLRVTMYGQQAIVLDTTGTLSRLGKRRAGIWWIGKTLEEIEDEES